jgi:hypothetical protein
MEKFDRRGEETHMSGFTRAIMAMFLVLILGETLLQSATSAQTTKPATSTPQAKEVNRDDQGWHADITPYIWFAGVNGTVGALEHETSVHASFGDIFQYFNIGLMGDGEVRYNRIVMPIDFMWMKLSDDHGLPIEDAGGGTLSIKAKMTETIVTPKIGYRVVSNKNLKVDALFGFRYWHLSNDLSLQPTQPEGSFSASANWVDAVAGAKFAWWMTPKMVVTVAGDAGGASARSDYQVAGVLGYRISRRWVLQAGYRYLSVNYRPARSKLFVYDVTMPGLIIGATYNIK